MDQGELAEKDENMLLNEPISSHLKMLPFTPFELEMQSNFQLNETDPQSVQMALKCLSNLAL